MCIYILTAIWIQQIFVIFDKAPLHVRPMDIRSPGLSAIESRYIKLDMASRRDSVFSDQVNDSANNDSADPSVPEMEIFFTRMIDHTSITELTSGLAARWGHVPSFPLLRLKDGQGYSRWADRRHFDNRNNADLLYESQEHSVGLDSWKTDDVPDFGLPGSHYPPWNVQQDYSHAKDLDYLPDVATNRIFYTEPHDSDADQPSQHQRDVYGLGNGSFIRLTDIAMESEAVELVGCQWSRWVPQNEYDPGKHRYQLHPAVLENPVLLVKQPRAMQVSSGTYQETRGQAKNHIQKKRKTIMNESSAQKPHEKKFGSQVAIAPTASKKLSSGAVVKTEDVQLPSRLAPEAELDDFYGITKFSFSDTVTAPPPPVSELDAQVLEKSDLKKETKPMTSNPSQPQPGPETTVKPKPIRRHTGTRARTKTAQQVEKLPNGTWNNVTRTAIHELKREDGNFCMRENLKCARVLRALFPQMFPLTISDVELSQKVRGQWGEHVQRHWAGVMALKQEDEPLRTELRRKIIATGLLE